MHLDRYYLRVPLHLSMYAYGMPMYKICFNLWLYLPSFLFFFGAFNTKDKWETDSSTAEGAASFS